MKGIDYVAVDPGIAKDVKVAEMAAVLKRDRHWIAGHFPQFLGEVARHAPDGVLAGVEDDLLDDWAGGVKGWGREVRRLMCDPETGQLTAWWKYNGRALEKLQRDRDRKNAGRAPGKIPPKRTAPAEEIPRKVHGKSTESPRKVVCVSTGYTDTDTDTVTAGESPTGIPLQNNLRSERNAPPWNALSTPASDEAARHAALEMIRAESAEMRRLTGRSAAGAPTSPGEAA